MKIAVFIFLSLLSWEGCTKNSQKEKFPYMVTMTAPKEYPVEVHIGVLTDDKKKLICGVPKSGVVNTRWVYDGKNGGQGGNTVPSHLNLTYVSYAEKKFWRVDADLPKEKILQLFREGFMIQGNPDDKGEFPWEESTYDELTIGAAPGGVIVVWLSGNHHRREVCRLQAKETFVNKDEFMRRIDPKETQEQFYELSYKILVPDSTKQKIKENGIPFGIWDQYREKYKYRFVLRPYDEKDKIRRIYRINYDGESGFLMDAKAVETYRQDGIPYNVEFSFTKYYTEVFFDDMEMLDIFKKLKAKYPDKPIDIIITPTFMYNEMKLSVKCESEEIPLKKYKVKGVWGG
ncbi:DUF2931 family protein [Chryseobacterium rhizosphaerae]|uniref:DUF2931 family protein n=1 Tax=Chryseobacterium rhizosphaerae TaxID=395937 RepID=UPI002359500C|nr:DUF2931 family protein [Chryseobacterium rhizosphaerae]MDC8100904.1 DUF2931 family protein [Chryseobacterium rhizosphaerae]